jgi:hypothetical protein
MIKIHPAVLAFTLFLPLAACGTPSEPVNIDSATPGYRITCGGAYSLTSDCYEKAGYLCGNRGYTAIRETDITPPADANYFWNAAAHEVVIKCNSPK